MAIIFLTSSLKRAGKTAVAGALGLHMVKRGMKVGYLKPVLHSDEAPAKEDGAIASLLGIKEDAQTLAPAFAAADALRSGIKEAIAQAAHGKDTMIIEGPSAQRHLAADLASDLNAIIVGVESYSPDPMPAAQYYSQMPVRLAGIIVNKAPRSRLPQVREEYEKALGSTRLLGIIPEERTVGSLTVDELIRSIDGEVIGSAPDGKAVIESIMIGAMNPDHGPEYYSLRERKATIIRSDKPDMQLAALETPTSALVLSGGKPPIKMVTMRAASNQVPIIVSKASTNAVVDQIQTALGQATLDQAKALRFSGLMEEALDVEALLTSLGVRRTA